MKSQRGFTLIEVIVAVALMATIGIALLAALGGASKVLLKADSRETARDLAEAQMEYVQSQSYSTTVPYTPNPAIDAKYPGYTTAIPAPILELQTDLQEITVIVYQGTVEKISITGHKVNW